MTKKEFIEKTGIDVNNDEYGAFYAVLCNSSFEDRDFYDAINEVGLDSIPYHLILDVGGSILDYERKVSDLRKDCSELASIIAKQAELIKKLVNQ